jgi:hypothetical protein
VCGFLAYRSYSSYRVLKENCLAHLQAQVEVHARELADAEAQQAALREDLLRMNEAAARDPRLADEARRVSDDSIRNAQANVDITRQLLAVTRARVSQVTEMNWWTFDRVACSKVVAEAIPPQPVSAAQHPQTLAATARREGSARTAPATRPATLPATRPDDGGLAALADKLANATRVLHERAFRDEKDMTGTVTVSVISATLKTTDPPAPPRGQIVLAVKENVRAVGGGASMRTAYQYDISLVRKGREWTCDAATRTIRSQATREGPTDEIGTQKDVSKIIGMLVEVVEAAPASTRATDRR